MYVVEYRRLSATIADYFTEQCFAGKIKTILAVKLKHRGRRTYTAWAFTGYNWFSRPDRSIENSFGILAVHDGVFLGDQSKPAQKQLTT